MIESSELDSALREVIKTTLQGVAFVHEIAAKKWFYYGYYLEHYPQVYHIVPLLSYSDLALFQMLLACDNTEEEQGPSNDYEQISDQAMPLIEYVISHFDLDSQLVSLLQGIKTRNLTNQSFGNFV